MKYQPTLKEFFEEQLTRFKEGSKEYNLIKTELLKEINTEQNDY